MKASERHRTRRENAFKLLTNHKAKRSKTNFSPVFHRPASKKKNESMICKKSVEDVVRTKSLTSFVNLENRAKDDDDSSRAASFCCPSCWTRTKNDSKERKFRFHETSKLLPHIQRGKKHKSRAFVHLLFFLCICFVFFPIAELCHSGVRVFVIATITAAAARDEKKNGSFATTIAASSQKRERERKREREKRVPKRR
jgi:hypothetical protein